jgi:hypothetical protein
LEIDENLTNSAMYVIRQWSIIVSSEVDQFDGIFILGEDAKLTATRIRNDDEDNDRDSTGGLVIRGVVVGGQIESLIEARRSVLRGWFYNRDKDTMFREGASLRIQNNPRLRITPPPGVDELDSVFDVYKQ